MPQPLQHRRGAVLPASLAEGEFFFKTDTQVWYSGPTGGGTPIAANSVRKVGYVKLFTDPVGVTTAGDFFTLDDESAYPVTLGSGSAISVDPQVPGFAVVAGMCSNFVTDFEGAAPVAFCTFDNDADFSIRVFNSSFAPSSLPPNSILTVFLFMART
jgi:hypothetical protein